MTDKLLLGSWIALAVILSSCTRREPGVYVEGPARAYEDLSSDDVLVEVDDCILKKKDAEAAVSLRAKLFTLATPKFDAKVVAGYKNRVRQRIVREWVLKTLFKNEAVHSKLAVSADDEKRRNDFMSPIFRRRLGATDEALKEALGDDLVQYKKEREEEILLWALYRDRGLVNVRDRLIEDHMARVKDYNRRIAESNRWIMAKGAAIKEKILSGADFKAAVKKYSEESYPLPEGDMGWCTAEEIDEDEINSVVFTAAVNSVVGPFDTEDGLQILRVEGHGSTDEEILIRRKPTVKLRRIRLRLLADAKVLDKKQTYQEIVNSRIAEFKKASYKELLKRAVIVYPNGTNLFPRVNGTMGTRRNKQKKGAFHEAQK